MDWPYSIRKDIADTYFNKLGDELRDSLGSNSLWWLTGVYIIIEKHIRYMPHPWS